MSIVRSRFKQRSEIELFSEGYLFRSPSQIVSALQGHLSEARNTLLSEIYTGFWGDYGFLNNHTTLFQTYLKICMIKLVANPCYTRNVSGGINSPRINRGNCLFTQKWKLTANPLHDDCWSPPGSTEVITFSHESKSWLLILSMMIINLHQDQQRWSPFHAKVKVNCWSSPWWLSSPAGSTKVITSLCWLLISSMLTVDWPPIFLIFNIRMMHQKDLYCAKVWNQFTIFKVEILTSMQILSNFEVEILTYAMI